jgi:hypothetical protein
MTMFGSQWLANAGSTYEIEQSVRFNSVDDAKLSRTPDSDGSTTTFTISLWVKRSTTTIINSMYQGFSGTSSAGNLRWLLDGRLQFYDNDGTGNGLLTTALFRDPSSWYHIVAIWDTSNATSTDRLRLYSNGDRITSFDSSTFPAVNYATTYFNRSAYVQQIGFTSSGSTYSDFLLAEYNFIDGTAVEPSSFGETNSDTGQWVPKEYEGSYGTNGFYLKGQDSSALGDDTSGNGNDFSSSGLFGNDQMSDSPTSNHCTWNPLQTGTTITSMSDGNLVLSGTSGAAAKWMSLGTMPVSSGKWYYEITSGGTRIGAGFTTSGSLTQANLNTGPIDVAAETFVITNAGEIYYGTTDSGNTTPAFGSGVTMGFALDADEGKAWVTVNGSDWADSSSGTSGDPTDGSNPTWTQTIGTPVQPLCGDTSGGSFVTLATANFGQSAFAYTPPTGYNAWNTDNLPAPAIEDPSAYFQTTLYEGDGSTQSIDQDGNSTFSPNFVWIKNRDAADAHALFDTVRGATEVLSSNSTAAEATNDDTLTAFESDGFAIGDDVIVNTNAESYVAWQWAEGATPGLDIIAYTGNGSNRTIAHNLGVKPGMFIVKARDRDDANWGVYHSAVGATKSLFLQSAGAAFDSDEYFNDTEPTASVFTLGVNAQGNTDTKTYIAYVFAPVEGFSAFGSYAGNSSTNGPMVNLGFRPAFLICKVGTGSTGSWRLFDTTRNPSNVTNKLIYPNLSNAEATSAELDILSNGFKIRVAGGYDINDSGDTIVYMAFAENPFKTANAR